MIALWTNCCMCYILDICRTKFEWPFSMLNQAMIIYKNRIVFSSERHCTRMHAQGC
jgi:hypothetical protein